MGAPDHRSAGTGTTPARRRFVTRHDVDDAASAGTGLRLGPLDVMTHEAVARARDVGVTVTRDAAAGAPGVAADAPGGPAEGRPGAGSVTLRAAVRAAVIAELGHEPAGLDDVIDRVLRRHD